MGDHFKQALKEATGNTWEVWLKKLDQAVDPQWSNEQIKEHIRTNFQTSGEWGEWIAVMYGQSLGRVPVGVTKDAGVQIGVRRTLAISKEQLWSFLLSPEGLSLWIGDVSNFTIGVGHNYESKEGVSGKITVVLPFKKLRMTWKRPEWKYPSRLQITLISTTSGKTTLAIHQEMLEDVYMREIMRSYWEDILNTIKRGEAI